MPNTRPAGAGGGGGAVLCVYVALNGARATSDTSGCDALAGDSTAMGDAVEYAVMVHVGVVPQFSEAALVEVAIAVLTAEAPLSVGEIGIRMSSETRKQVCKEYMKEKFGGLKKFLERYPDVFEVRALASRARRLVVCARATAADHSGVACGRWGRTTSSVPMLR